MSTELGRRSFLATVGTATIVAISCRGKPEGSPRQGGDRRSASTPRILEGKTCLVTGATSGMGAVTALELARLGATVTVAGRNAEKCAARAAAIRRETGARVETAVADLASRDQVRRLATEIADRWDRLDILVNNAATVLFERTLTVDGLEQTFAVNYLAQFLLTNLLMDRLRASPSARVVNVASSEHHLGRIEFDNLQGERRYERMDAYRRSKLAVVMFTYELARRLEGSSVSANALHPGTVASDLGDDNGFLRGWVRVRVRNVFRRWSWMRPEQGARNIVHAASSPDLEGRTGRYFDQGRDVASSPSSYDEAVARRLWEVSAELCGLPSERAASPPGALQHRVD